MKKLMLAMAIALAAAGIVSAQGWGASQSVSVQGTLTLQNGVIVLNSGNTVYYVPRLSRYAGFIEGLKEGAQVSVEGWQTGAGFLMPSKITVSGKEYELANGYGGMADSGWGGYCGGWSTAGYGRGGRRGRGCW